MGEGIIFSYNPFEGNIRCHVDWGRRGAKRAVERGDIIVVVDVLSFSSVVATATHRGAMIYPCLWEDDPGAIAEKVGGVAAVRRAEVPAKGPFSLSPLTYLKIEPGTRVILPSPNGATISRLVDQVPHLLTGALINARATAKALNAILIKSDLNVTLIACGEREKGSHGQIRWAVEDYLGAGAILSELGFEKSTEAKVSEGAFIHHKNDLDEILWDCESGIELREMGFGDDVKYAARLNEIDCAAIMRNDHYQNQTA